MKGNTSVSLGPYFENFINSEIEKGRYNSASEVIRESLRRQIAHQQQVAILVAALEEGEASGPGKELDFDAFLDEMHKRVEK